MLRKFIIILYMLLLIMLIGCSERSDGNVTDINIIGSSKAKINESVKLGVVAHADDEDGNDSASKASPKSISWEVMNSGGYEISDGAKVSSDGIFTATKPGKYTVRAHAYTKVDSIIINVTDSEAPALQRQKSSTNAYKNKKEEQLFYNGNNATVYNGGKSPEFKLEKTTLLTLIQTYHWNDAKGTASPGKISVKDSSGKVYGPWKANGAPGMGDVKNAYWNHKPNIVLAPGTYTVIDTDPSTWAQNSISKGVGMVWVYGKQ